jgi:hypothetical protein
MFDVFFGGFLISRDPVRLWARTLAMSWWGSAPGSVMVENATMFRADPCCARAEGSNMASNISISSGKDGCLQLWRYQPGTLRQVACEVQLGLGE